MVLTKITTVFHWRKKQRSVQTWTSLAGRCKEQVRGWRKMSPAFSCPLLVTTESFDPATSWLQEGKPSLLFGLLQPPGPLCCPACPSSCPLSIAAFHIPFPCSHSPQPAFCFFFFFNRRKASPPNLIPAPLSQADVTFTSVRLLERPAPPAQQMLPPPRQQRGGVGRGGKQKKKQGSDPSAGGGLNATARPRGAKREKNPGRVSELTLTAPLPIPSGDARRGAARRPPHRAALGKASEGTPTPVPGACCGHG